MTPSVARKKAEASDFHLSKTGKRGELIQARLKDVWVKFGRQFAIRLSGRSCHKISVRWSLSVHKKWLSPVIQQGFREDLFSIRLLDILLSSVKYYLSMFKKCLLPVIQPGFRAEIFYREHKALKDEVGWHCRKSPCSMLLLMDFGRRMRNCDKSQVSWKRRQLFRLPPNVARLAWDAFGWGELQQGLR